MFIEFNGQLINKAIILTAFASERTNDDDELIGYWIKFEMDDWSMAEYFNVDEFNKWDERWKEVRNNLLGKS